MKHSVMTYEQMMFYVKNMDQSYKNLRQSRDRLLEEIKALQKRNEIVSWNEIASAVAFPKILSDNDGIHTGNPDEFKLFHQAERINNIYRSQMEELFSSLEGVELEISKYQYVNRCITNLGTKDREILNQFTRKNLTFEKGSEQLNLVRSTLYKMQRRALIHLVEMYNSDN